MARARRWRTFVEGADELAKMFEDMGDVAQDILEQASKEAAEIVLASAKQKVPVDTGKLRDSLDIKLEKTRRESKKIWQVYSKGVSKGGVRYGFAVEGGTYKMKAQPFLRPALDENKERIKDKIGEVIGARLEAIG